MENGNLMWEEEGISLILMDDSGEVQYLTIDDALMMGYELPEVSDPREEARLQKNLEELADKIEAEEREAEAQEVGTQKTKVQQESKEQKPKTQKAKAQSAKKPKQASPYDSERWRALKTQANFARRSQRVDLFASLKKGYSPREALQGYYSCLLELTYVIGDYSWAIKAKKNKDAGVPEVVEMLKKRQIDDEKLATLVNKATLALDTAFSELNNWNELLCFAKIDQATRERVTKSLRDDNRVKWFRAQLREDLMKLNTSIPPKNLAFLFRQRHIVEARNKKVND